MYTIVGKDNLEAVNVMADDCINLLDQLAREAKDEVVIDKHLVQRMAQAYLFMYNKSIEHGVMPSIKRNPSHFYDEFLH
jgi:hypothetical protein